MDPQHAGSGPGGERWLDEAAGPIVRPYAMTKGRTAPRGLRLDLVTILVTTGRAPAEHMRVSPEQRRLLILAGRPSTVADLASEIDLPLGVVRVLLGDLIQQGLLTIQPMPQRPSGPAFRDAPLGRPFGDQVLSTPAAADPPAVPERPDRLLLTRVLNDLRAL
jgi:Protein of unknown function (DUF742)